MNTRGDNLGTTRSVRVVLYSHDAMGIGHLRRNLRLAHALTSSIENCSILLISGVAEGTWYHLPQGVDLLSLPSLRKSQDGEYVARRLAMQPDDIVAMRSRTIASCVEAFEPDAVIVDKLPRGVADELAPTLSALENSSTRFVLGLRDILDEPTTVKTEWENGDYDRAIDRYYDAVWVYGDPDFYDTAEEYGFSAAVRNKTRYAGLLDRVECPNAPADPLAEIVPAGQKVVLCTCGGGEDGASLAHSFARATFPIGHVGVILTGPFMPARDRAELQHISGIRKDLHVMEFFPDPIQLMRRSERVVLMGGYNTVCEVLSTDLPALVVPRVVPRSEQLIRATILAERGMAGMLHPADATPENITNWLAHPPHPTSARQQIDFGGLQRVPQMLRDLLAGTTPSISVDAKGRAAHVVS